MTVVSVDYSELCRIEADAMSQNTGKKTKNRKSSFEQIGRCFMRKRMKNCERTKKGSVFIKVSPRRNILKCSCPRNARSLLQHERHTSEATIPSFPASFEPWDHRERAQSTVGLPMRSTQKNPLIPITDRLLCRIRNYQGSFLILKLSILIFLSQCNVINL